MLGRVGGRVDPASYISSCSFKVFQAAMKWQWYVKKAFIDQPN